MAGRKTKNTAVFGDFQTPDVLATTACSLLQALGVKPASIVEPTCGVGSFLYAALERFPDVQRALGVDINPEYIEATRTKLKPLPAGRIVALTCANFFNTDWSNLLARLPEPILVVGNPPWVTNSQLGSLGSDNLPVKSNFQNHAGFDALTGKSNFDISEWMLVHLLERLKGKDAILAVLCKTAVARKALAQAWKIGISIESSALYLIDASAHFGAAVDACFLICKLHKDLNSPNCSVFNNLASSTPSKIFGYRERKLVADVVAYDAWKHLQGEEHYQWRSGVKHDCSGVMEFQRVGNDLINGLGEHVDIEAEYLYPMLKSSDIAAGRVETGRMMLVPQTTTGESTSTIKGYAPRTWDYLQRHADLLDRRGSSIYKNRPRFSIFGIGPYSFAPWKVAISGFYKSLNFRIVGSISGKPVMLDDTANFIPCKDREEAVCLADLLNSPAAAEFFGAFVFWDAKRPVTVDLLRRLDIRRLAEFLGKSSLLDQFSPQAKGSTPELSLFAV